LRESNSQNYPFHPIYDAWQADSRDLLPYDDVLARSHVEIIEAKVLSNRKPPYSLAGGLYDALKDTGGEVQIINNKDARIAAQLFKELEGIDIHPAAAIATASLMSKVKEHNFDKNALIMLNITGGGEDRFQEENELYYLKPEYIRALEDIYHGTVGETLVSYYFEGKRSAEDIQSSLLDFDRMGEEVEL